MVRGKLNLLLAMMVILSMAACSAKDSQTSQENASATSRASGAELPLQTKLILGTFKLEETDWAVTPEQASILLPLWKALHSLSQSDTAAEEELIALIEQIQESMTPEQIKAIDNMALSAEDVSAVMQDMGLQLGGAQRGESAGDGDGTRPFSGDPPGDMPQRGFPEGGMPGGGQGNRQGGGGFGPGGFGQDINPELLATMEARRAERAGSAGRMADYFLINPLIIFLEGKLQS